MNVPGMVIIGAGEAGARAALGLREAGYGGPVTLIGEEPHAPYERPPLSKAAMTCAETPIPKFVFGESAVRRGRHSSSCACAGRCDRPR